MTTISQKEKILLGYDPSSPPKTPSRSSDIDFSDVFGGPPRRSSHQSEDNDGDMWRRGDGEGNSEMATGRSHSWSINPGEKPVFGSEVSSRRRHHGQDFYDDIFRGDSQSSSPRISARDPMSSSPGSRVLSPARPLPPGVVPLGSPAQFSLPARLATSHSTSSLSRQSPLSYKSAAAAADRDVIKKDDNSDAIGGKTQVKNAGNHFHFSIHKWASKGVPLVMSLGSKNSLRSKIMLERSLGLNENDEVESDNLVGEIQSVGVNADDVLSFKVHVVSAAKDSKESDQIFDKSEPDIPNLRAVLKRSASKEMKIVTKPDVDASKSVLKRSSSKLGGVEGKTGTDSAVSEVRVNKRVEENKSAASSGVDKKEHIKEAGESETKVEIGLKGKSKKSNVNNQKKLGQDSKESDQIVDKSEPDIPILRTLLKRTVSKEMKNVLKPDIYASKSALKRSSSKLGGVDGRTDNDSPVPEVKVNKKVVENKSAASSNVDKKEHIEEVGKSKQKKEQSDLKGDHQKNLDYGTAKENANKSIGNNKFTAEVKGDTDKDGGKGKVKDFVKIFNKEPIIKTVADLDGLSPSGRWRNVEVPRENSKTTPSSAKTDVNYSSDPSPQVDENHTTPSSGKQSDAKNVQEPSQSSFMESETKASVNLKSSSADIDAEFDSILIEELPQAQDKTPENSENAEDMQGYESKIAKWSKGKEGNIRALLSTLQYVLWPDSGWKPVPLVNIIEANAVKRSYQRALLYLHPDKLQQKGAAPYQKFIAEKVFDILQEAWDHFNNLGSL